MILNDNHYIWVEKYRAQTLDDVIIPESIRNQFKNYVDKNEIPNLGLFSSIPGTGKTTLAGALLKDLNADKIWINASKDNGIDILRNKISGFASSISLTDSIKIVVCDEADYITGASQAAFRGDLEIYSKSCRFIFTANYTEKIIEPLLNRLVIFDLDDIYQKYKKELGSQIYKRLCFILENEGIEYSKNSIQEIITTYYPSIRQMIMVLQGSIIDNKISIDRLKSKNTNELFINLTKSIKEKNFSEMRKIVEELSVPDMYMNYLFKNLNTHFEVQLHPIIILLLAKHQEMSKNAKFPNITLTALCVEIMKVI